MIGQVTEISNLHFRVRGHLLASLYNGLNDTPLLPADVLTELLTLKQAIKWA